MCIYVVRHEGAEPSDPLADVGIVNKGVEVLQHLRDVASAWAMLLRLIYSLNLSFPKDLKYTCEAL